MKVSIATICDAATVSENKMNILGSFDTLYVRDVPAVHAECSFAFQLLMDSTDVDVNELQIKVVNDDGEEMFPPASITLTRRSPTEKGWSQANFVLNVRELKITRLGECRAVLIGNGAELVSIPFYVQKVMPAGR